MKKILPLGSLAGAVILLLLIIQSYGSTTFNIKASPAEELTEHMEETIQPQDLLSDNLTNHYYSKYDTKINAGYTPIDGSTTSLTQYRMNCYGYALRLLLQGTTTYYEDFGGFKQQPGWFVSYADMNNTQSISMLLTPSVLMDNVETNMILDANRLGYSVFPYTPAATDPIITFSESARLIALVTGNNRPDMKSDYHFYMQHSDGTWSHKPGSTEVRNDSLTSHIALTNQNIRQLANEDVYANGSIRFYIITRDAIFDHPHATYIPGIQTAIYDADVAGDYPENADLVTLDANYYGGYWDFSEDADYYRFTAVYSVVSFEAWSTDGEFRLDLYDSAKQLVGSEEGPNLVLSHIFTGLTPGDTYYFCLINTEGEEAEYSWQAQ